MLTISGSVSLIPLQTLVFPWPFETSSATEILLSHVLEHLGEKRDTYLKIIQELYRVSAPDAVIKISVPHPRHDDF